MKVKYLLIAFLILALLFFIISPFLDYRPQYCLENKCVDKLVFSELPRFTLDFTENVRNADENSWKQPEFYSNTWVRDGIRYYTNPPAGYLGVQGYGVYPSDNLINVKANEEVETFFFVHSSFYVVNYQGLRLVANYNTSEVEVELDPEIMLLEATYPIFEYNWTQKVKLKVTVKDVPKGEYKVTIDIFAPPIEASNEWNSKYSGKYIAAGSIGIGKPFYQLTLRVS